MSEMKSNGLRKKMINQFCFGYSHDIIGLRNGDLLRLAFLKKEARHLTNVTVFGRQPEKVEYFINI